MSVARVAAMALALLPLAATAQPGLFSTADLSGGELFERFCASCHGETGRGDGRVAASLAVPVPDLTRIVERYGRFPAQELREIIDGRTMVIAHGTRYMPVWGYEFWWEEGADSVAETRARELINRLVEHLRSIQEGATDARPR